MRAGVLKYAIVVLGNTLVVLGYAIVVQGYAIVVLGCAIVVQGYTTLVVLVVLGRVMLVVLGWGVGCAQAC